VARYKIIFDAVLLQCIRFEATFCFCGVLEFFTRRALLSSFGCERCLFHANLSLFISNFTNIVYKITIIIIISRKIIVNYSKLSIINDKLLKLLNNV
jgi:hypothetical protein